MDFHEEIRNRLEEAWNLAFGNNEIPQIFGDLRYDRNGLLIKGCKWNCGGFEYELVAIQRSQHDCAEVFLMIFQSARDDLGIPRIDFLVSVYDRTDGFWFPSEEGEEEERYLTRLNGAFAKEPKMKWVGIRGATYVACTGDVSPTYEFHEWWICDPLVNPCLDMQDREDYPYFWLIRN